MSNHETLEQLNGACVDPKRPMPEMQPYRMEFTALVRDLRLNSSGVLGGFIANIADAAVSYRELNNSNHYAYSLWFTLNSLGDTMGIVAPIYDSGRSSWLSLYDSPFSASADSAATMRLPFDLKKRHESYDRLMSRVASVNNMRMQLDKAEVVKYFELLAVREHKTDFKKPYGLEDWLYATLFLTLSNENLMKPLEYSERKSHVDLAIFGALAMLTTEKPLRERNEITAADRRVDAVMENLSNNRYFLSLPQEVDVEPILITRD